MTGIYLPATAAWMTGTRLEWVRAVPAPFYDGLLARCVAAWAVLTGRAYPVRWPEAGELEQALARGSAVRTSLPTATWRKLYTGEPKGASGGHGALRVTPLEILRWRKPR